MPAKRKELKIENANLWYLVGLIASDGNLSKDGRHIDITSKEHNFLQTIKERLGLNSRVCIKNRGTYKQAYRIQISNKNLYEFLLNIGLTPNKSLTINNMVIPQDYFVDFLRGLIDGDGGMQRWIHPANGREQWNLRITSGSRHFLTWLKNRMEEIIGVRGKLHCESATRFRLKYGKIAAREIIRQCYYKDCLGLDRKIKLAQECLVSNIGWAHSKTVLH